MSDEDIAKGTRWPNAIAKKLEQAKFGVFCLTTENLDSKWLHFEAGAISKITDESRVCTFLLGLEHDSIQGPLHHFQHTETTQEDVARLYAAINNSAGKDGLDSEQVEESFALWWPRLKQELDAIGEAPELKEVAEAVPQDPDYVRNEILETVRRIEAVCAAGGRVTAIDYESRLQGIERAIVRSIHQSPQRDWRSASHNQIPG